MGVVGLVLLGTLAWISYVKAITINDYTGNSRETEILDDVPPCVESKTDLYKIALRQYSQQYGVDYDLLYEIVQCESSWNDKAVGDNGKAYSLAQFHRPTFDRFCEGEYENPFNQLECMAKMFSEGLQDHWTCYYKVLGHTS